MTTIRHLASIGPCFQRDYITCIGRRIVARPRKLGWGRSNPICVAKGTDELEGYSLHDKGYFGPGRLPNFERSFFDIPHGRREDWLFEQFKERLAGDDIPTDGELTEFTRNVKSAIDKNLVTRDT